MQKSFICISLALMAGLTAQSRSLSPSEALGRAFEQSKARVSRSASPVQVMTVDNDGMAALYVFNNTSGGYMIVSADDVAAPVIGYSDSGTLDPENLPDNLRWWLEQSARQIVAASAAGAAPYVQSDNATDRDPIAPLMTTQWNQDAPFYNDCPTLNGQPTMAGCVATAMAQVMKYHNWPDKGADNAMFSYGWNGQTLSADFRNYAFDWANMINNYGNGYTTEQGSAVAKLLQACGYSIGMYYGPVSSGSFGAYVGGALADYFKYDGGFHNEPRDLYSAPKWEEMIYNDLRDCGPVLYWGYGTAGHCFVCDGYRGDHYFHFNWGWGGLSDGYFLLNALSPGATGIGGSNGGFNQGQGVLLGVKPSNGTQTPHRYTFYASNGVSDVFMGTNGLELYGQFFNYSSYTVPANFSFRIYSEDGSKFIQSCPAESYDKEFYHNNYQNSIFGKIPASLPDGTYRIYPAIEVEGEAYQFRTPAGYPDHALYTRKDGVDTAVVPAAEGEVSIEGLSTNGDLYLDKRFKVSGIAKFSREGGDVDRYVTASLLRPDGSILGSGSSASIQFSYEGNEFEFISNWFTKSGLKVDIEPGEYTFAIQENYRTIASCPVTIKADAPAGDYKVTKLEINYIDDAQNIDPKNVIVTAYVEGLSGVVDENLQFNFYNSYSALTPLFNITGSVPFFVSEGQTTVVKLATAFKYTVPTSGSFFVRCGRVTGSSISFKSDKAYFNIGAQSGIEGIETDDNAPVEYFNLQGIKVDGENLLPGVYIKRQGQKTVKILVK